MAEEKLVIIRIRGIEGVKNEIKDTFNMLRLGRNHTCSVYPKTPATLGMAVKCKDYVTYGEIDEETYKLLVEKRGKKDKTTGQLNNYFQLNSPKGGFERKGIKISFQNKGALGYRGEKINLLVRKMIHD